MAPSKLSEYIKGIERKVETYREKKAKRQKERERERGAGGRAKGRKSRWLSEACHYSRWKNRLGLEGEGKVQFF
jgi:hypothetical protein